MKKIHRLIGNISIRYKLFLSCLLLLVVPLLLFTILVSRISSADAAKRSLESAKKVLSQASTFLEYKTSTIKNVMDIAVLDPNLQEIATRPASYYTKNVGNGWIDNAKFYKLTFTLHSNPDISNICMYMKGGIAAAEETEQFKTIGRVKNTAWYQSMLKSKAVYEWLPSSYFPEEIHPNTVYFLRKIPSSDNINDFIGLLKVDINSNILSELLTQAVMTHHSTVLLSNSRNELICSSGTVNAALLSLAEKIKPAGVEDRTWQIIKFNGQKYLIGEERILRTDMTLSLIVPYKDILELSTKLRIPMILIILLLIGTITPLSYWFATSGTKRIRVLSKHMKKMQGGELKPLPIGSSSDEIGELFTDFNHMIDRIQKLIEEQFQFGKEIKNKELKALQSQINPHFLYNTLDLINWMSMKYQADEIRQVVSSLSRFYKLSLSNGKDLIPIEKEIELVSVYLQIQNIRFQNSIKVQINIPEELMHFTIPKITLQPLVENAILHGILEKESETGSIHITGHLDGTDVKLVIEDDGVGMTENSIHHLMEFVPEKERHGYGIRNINERLRLIYGEQYGLRYESLAGSGTIVTLHIPAVEG